MTHERKVREEFARQAAPLSRSAEFRSPEILERIAAAVAAGPEDRVLDVACGPGLVAVRLARDAAEVTGVDLTPEMLERAKEHAREQGVSNARFELAKAESLPFDDAVFDRVVSRLAVHHLLDPDAALREMHRVLRPGGTLVIADIVASDDPAEAALHNALEILRDPSHVRMLPKSELLARIAGLKLEAELCDAWSRERRFDEWLAITGDASRAAALRQVMSELARRGADAGIGLRVDAGDPAFDHHWVIVRGVKAAC